MSWDKRATTRRTSDYEDRDSGTPDAHIIYVGRLDEGGPDAEPLRLGDRFLLKRGETLTFGRSERCDVTIRSEELSRAHALLSFLPGHQGKLALIDLESRNGCSVAGREAPIHELSPGDEFTLAHAYRFRYQPAY